MARDTDASDAPIPLRLFPSDLTARSLSAPFKVDEGYADDTRSQADKELLRIPSDDVMSIPDWVLAHSETERAGKPQSLLSAPVVCWPVVDMKLTISYFPP